MSTRPREASAAMAPVLAGGVSLEGLCEDPPFELPMFELFETDVCTERQTPWPMPSPTSTATTRSRAVTVAGRVRRG